MVTSAVSGFLGKFLLILGKIKMTKTTRKAANPKAPQKKQEKTERKKASQLIFITAEVLSFFLSNILRTIKTQTASISNNISCTLKAGSGKSDR
jgi:hypothetical protein